METSTTCSGGEFRRRTFRSSAPDLWARSCALHVFEMEVCARDGRRTDPVRAGQEGDAHGGKSGFVGIHRGNGGSGIGRARMRPHDGERLRGATRIAGAVRSRPSRPPVADMSPGVRAEFRARGAPPNRTHRVPGGLHGPDSRARIRRSDQQFSTSRSTQYSTPQLDERRPERPRVMHIMRRRP